MTTTIMLLMLILQFFGGLAIYEECFMTRKSRVILALCIFLCPLGWAFGMGYFIKKIQEMISE